MAAARLIRDDDVVMGGNDQDELDFASDYEGSAGGIAPDEPSASGPVDVTVKPTRKRATRPRPKLTVDKLKEPSGFNHVFHTFPRVFQAGFRGKGHEVADLQRLLELYARWQARIFPHCTFDEFLAKLEKISSTHVLKSELNSLRQQLILLLDDEQEAAGDVAGGERGPVLTTSMPVSLPHMTPGGPSLAPGTGDARPAGQAVPARASPPAGLLDDEALDEELMAMQADDKWDVAMDVMDETEAQPVLAGPGRQGAATSDHATGMHQQPSVAVAGATEGPAAADEEDLEAVLGEGPPEDDCLEFGADPDVLYQFLDPNE